MQPERKTTSAPLLVTAAVAELQTGPDGLETILAAHGPRDADQAARLMRIMSKVACVLIASPDLGVPRSLLVCPSADETHLQLGVPDQKTKGAAAAAVMGWLTELDAEPEVVIDGTVPDDAGLLQISHFGRFSFGARLFVYCRYPAAAE